ncbi:aminoglycoside phosphotransferase family protein [Pantoea sp.]|uniref:aminoglycoside phosphotransferase family protein n=1 Tax=Pantoea sp. TaxID=69393 RepID=UPI00289AFFDC|nr:aminoglycoside phosphotransferase family protein [Pantoea sp.]
MINRLQTLLSIAEPAKNWQIAAGTAGVASPHRVAAEWQGFILTCGEERRYAKVLYEDQRPLIDVERSAAMSRLAGELRIAPRLLAVLIFDALDADWQWAKLDQLATAKGFDALRLQLDQLHQAPLPDVSATRYDAIERLHQLCERDAVPLPAEMRWFRQCAESAWQALRLSQPQAAFIHGDNIASNWMINNSGKLCLLDFDYAGAGDPWYDIATLLNELFPFEQQWREAIVAWRGRCGDADYARCRLYALLDDYYWTLWGFWSSHTSRRSLEFAKVGQWTLLRGRLCLQDPRFESWLRIISGGAV